MNMSETLLGGDDLFMYDSFSPLSDSNDMEVDIESNDFPEIDLLGDEGPAPFADGNYVPQISYSDSSAFDPEEIEGVSKWYSQQSELIHRHYESNMEYQKRKLDKENEAGLLECLQQSMDYLESDPVSDFAHLSSTLSQDAASSTIIVPVSTSQSPIPQAREIKQTDQSMLKKLLLCPVNSNYPKEIDSSNSDVNQKVKGTKKRKQKVKSNSANESKKPFAELLKHFESSESSASNSPNSEFKPELKLINNKRYQKKYGGSNTKRKMSAPTSREVSPSPPLIIHEKIDNRPLFTQSTDKIEDIELMETQNNVIMATTVDSSKDLSTDKPSPTDHDYCSSSNSSTTNTKQTTSVAQSNATRVLKWQDYLQQVRAGIRSAPNSPTTSPKIQRGSARNANNFMVNGVKIPQKKRVPSPPVIPAITAVKAPVTVTVPKQKTVLTAQDLIEMAKNKGSKGKVKLEEFDNYMARLKKNLKPDGSNKRIVILPKKLNADMKKSQPVKIPLNVDDAPNTSKTSTSKVTPKMVMVKLPTVSVIHKNGQVKSAVQNPQIPSIDKNNNKISDPRLLIRNSFVPQPELKLPQMASVLKTKPVPESKPAAILTKTTKASTSNTVPTFKLVTAGKDSTGGSKSLILSGVTGQLKDILLTLAKQQNKNKTSLINKTKPSQVVSDDRQQKTLQQLLSAISKLNAPKPKIVPSESASHQPSISQPTNIVPNSLNVESKTKTLPPRTQPIVASVTIPVNDHSPKVSVASILAPKDKIQPNHAETAATPSSPTPLIAVENIPHASGSIMQKVPESIEPVVDSIKFQNIEVTNPESITSSVVSPEPTSSSSVIKEDQENISKGALQSNLVSSTSTEEITSSTDVPIMKEEKMEVDETTSSLSQPSSSAVETKEDHPVITLEDAMASLEDDGLLNSCDDDEEEEQVEGSSLYSKLPSYLTTGKLVTKKELSSDGEIESENEEEGFDKLPHYFSSGKTTGEIDVQLRAKTEPIDDETFYSRLPSYYSYGRPSSVKTFNDDIQSESTDVNKKNKSKSRKRKLKKQKSKRSKKKKLPTPPPVQNKNRMFSKLPSYCLSGKLDKVDRKQSRKRSLSRSSSSSYSDRSRSRSRSRSYSSLSSRRSYSSSSTYFTSSSSESDSDRRYKRRSSRQKSYRTKSRRDRDYSRSKRKYKKYSDDEKTDSKKQHAIEERRVVYVGKISRSTTKRDLRSRFERFGEIVTITLHFRENSDSYGFITYVYTSDAFRAIEEGNNNLNPGEPYYELCFGGRREFCKVAYADLDDAPDTLSHDKFGNNEEDDFDSLLRMAQRGLH